MSVAPFKAESELKHSGSQAHRTRTAVTTESAGGAALSVGGQAEMKARSLVKSASKLTTLEKHKRSLEIDWNVERYISQRRKGRGGQVTARDKIYRAIASPASSSCAMLCSYFLHITTVASVMAVGSQLEYEALDPSGSSCVTAVAEDPNSPCLRDHFIFLSGVWLLVFAVELVVCILVYPTPWRQMDVWFNFISLVPLGLNVGFAANNMRAMDIEPRGLRLLVFFVLAFSPLRLIKIARIVPGVKLLFKALSDSVSALLIPLYVLFVLFLYFGFLVFAVEFDAQDLDNGSRVKSISESMWMCLVTMTTVGYGDFSPQTDLGKVIVGFVMLFGVCFLAMPISIVGNSFSASWEARTTVWVSNLLRKQMLVQGRHPSDVLAAFREIDANSDGIINYSEFRGAVERLVGDAFDKQRLRELWKTLDVDASDSVQFREFVNILYPDLEAEIIEDLDRSSEVDKGALGAAEKVDDTCPSPNVATSAPSESNLSSDRLAAIEASLESQANVAAKILAQQAELQHAMARMAEALARLEANAT